MCFRLKRPKGLKGTVTFLRIQIRMKKRSLSPLKKGGFFLIEILLVIVILSVSLTLIVQSLLSNLQVIKYNKEFSQAIIFLDNAMSKAGIEDSLGAEVDNSFLNSKEDFYQHDIEETVVDGNEESFLKTIEMDISWNSGKRNNRIAASTYSFVNKKNEKNEK